MGYKQIKSITEWVKRMHRFEFWVNLWSFCVPPVQLPYATAPKWCDKLQSCFLLMFYLLTLTVIKNVSFCRQYAVEKILVNFLYQSLWYVELTGLLINVFFLNWFSVATGCAKFIPFPHVWALSLQLFSLNVNIFFH